MILTLTRFAYLPTMTLGQLVVAGNRYATLEEPFLPNPQGPGGLPKSNTHPGSCVPDADYVLEPHDSPDHPDTWALVNPGVGVYHYSCPPGQLYGRIAVLIHSGNTTRDTQGCIIVGMRHGSTDESGIIDEVVDSREALTAIQGSLAPGKHQLKIRPYAGTIAQLWGAP